MILSLKIENFILVDKLLINFTNGLNMLTGETGAGKSVIIGAINALFDKKQMKDIFFDSRKKAFIEACFSIDNPNSDILEKYDIEPDENGEIFIYREFLPTNKRRTFINGRRVTQDIAFEFKDFLLDFHNQNKHLYYLENDYQLHLLDTFAHNEKNLIEYQKKYREVISLSTKLKKIIESEKEKADKIDLYKYQLEELEKASLKEDEDSLLEKEYHTLTHAEDILKNFSEIKFLFYENESSVYDIISEKINELKEFSDTDIVKEALEYLENISESLQSLNSVCRNAEDFISVDRERLEEVENRLDTINELKNKYKKNLSELLSYKEEIEARILNHQTSKTEIKIKEEELAKNVKTLLTLAEKLSKNRKEKAQHFAKEIENNLKKLSISDAVFKIKIDKKTASKEIFNKIKIPMIKGFDSVDFLFSANSGKNVSPLKYVASGGELSRIVLSIKKILSKNLRGKTLIFDEIDAGIGGKTAEVTGKFISDISKNAQVICITHLAQIASFANNHLKIEKRKSNKKTKIYLEKLDKKNRIIEIARMLSGNTSDSAINHAKEILNQ